MDRELMAIIVIQDGDNPSKTDNQRWKEVWNEEKTALPWKDSEKNKVV